jgi:hypothetical protein
MAMSLNSALETVASLRHDAMTQSRCTPPGMNVS